MRTVIACIFTLSLIFTSFQVFAQESSDNGGNAAQSIEEKIKHMDALWADRHKNGISQQGLEYARMLLRENAGSYDVAWRTARAAFWVAEHSSDKKVMEATGKEGYEAGLKAIELKPQGIDGYYWASAALGQYATGARILKALFRGLGSKYEELCEKALEINRAHDWAGPLRAYGRYWYSLPAVKRDLDKSKKYLEEAVKLAPMNLRNHAYLADTYFMAEEKDKALEHYTICANGKAESNDYPDAILQKKYCAGKLAELKK